MKGLETAVSDLQAWRVGVLPSTRQPSTDRLEARRALHGLIYANFSGDELEQLCFDLGVTADDLGDGSHNHRVMELVLLCIRNREMPRLRRRLRELRPAIEWPDVE